VLRNYLKIVRDRVLQQAAEIMRQQGTQTALSTRENASEEQSGNQDALDEYLREKNYDVTLTELDEFKRR
jgi:hypothetical protein